MKTREQRRLEREYRRNEKKRYRVAVAQGEEYGKYFPGILLGFMMIGLGIVTFFLPDKYYPNIRWVETALGFSAVILFASGIRIARRARKTGLHIWWALLCTVMVVAGVIFIVYVHYNPLRRDGLDTFWGIFASIVFVVLQCISLRMPKTLRLKRREEKKQKRAYIRTLKHNAQQNKVYESGSSDSGSGLGLGLGALLVGGVLLALGAGSGEDKSYVLNKRSGVIHDKWDDSADTIGENHRREISRSEADELVDRQTRYRYKQ